MVDEAVAITPVMTNIPPESLLYIPEVQVDHDLITEDNFAVPEGKDMYIYSATYDIVKLSTNIGGNKSVDLFPVDGIAAIKTLMQLNIPGSAAQFTQYRDVIDLSLNPFKMTTGEFVNFTETDVNFSVKVAISVFFLPKGTKFSI